MDRLKKSKYVNILVFIAALFIMGMWSRFAPQRGVGLVLSEEALELSGPEDFSVRIDFGDMAGLSLAGDEIDLGEMRKGVQSREAWCGTWENDRWGRYTLAIDPSIASYLVVEMSGGQTVVLNYESAEQTESLHEALAALTAAQQ